MKFKSIILCVILASVVFSCEKEDDSNGNSTTNPPDTTSTGDPSFECMIDGVAFDSHILLIAGAGGSSAGVTTRTASGTVFRSNGDTITVAITATSFDADAFAVGTTFDASNTLLGDYCFGNVNVNNGAVDIEASTEDTEMANVTITQYDESTETWSGTFSFTAEDDDIGVTYVVTEGEFSLVEFD
ncbi:MAG: hypothetical protein HKN79_03695 [Flavobacteriales bacterium]|nr:hypothetical protein [Flavobacteriales bacterium]